MRSGRKVLLALFLGGILTLLILNPMPSGGEEGEYDFNFNPFAMDETAAKESCRQSLEDLILSAVNLDGASDELREMIETAFDEFFEGACDINRFGELEVDIIPADTEGYVNVTYYIHGEMGIKLWSPWKDDYCWDPTNINNSDYESRCYTDLAPDFSSRVSQNIYENTTLFTMYGEFWYTESVGIEDFMSLDLLKIGIVVNLSDIRLEPKRGGYWAFDRWMGECVGNSDENGVCEITNLYYQTATWAFFKEVSNVTVEIVDQDGNPISPSFGVGVSIRDVFGHIDSYNLTETTRFEDVPVEGTNVTVIMRNPYFESSNGYRFDHVEYEGHVWGWDPDDPFARIGPHPGENTIRVVFWKRVKLRIEAVNDQGVHESASSWTWAPMDSFWVELSLTPPADAVSQSSRPGSGTYFHGDVMTVDAYTTGIATAYQGDAFHWFDHWEGACSGGGSTCSFSVGNVDEAVIRAVYWRIAKRVTVYFGWLPEGTVYFPQACRVAHLDFSPPSGSYHAPEPDGDYGWTQDAENVYVGSSVTVTPRDCTEYDLAVDHYEWNWGVTGDNTFVVNRWTNYVKVYYWVLVDLNIDPVDDLGQPMGCDVRLNFSAPDGSYHAPEPDGEYANTTIEDLYKKSTVIASPLSCPGHLFDHWETSGMSGDPSSGATLNDDATLRAVYWAIYPLGVQVTDELGDSSISCTVRLNFTPPSGAQNPLIGEDGLYNWNGFQLYRGTNVTFSSVPCRGYRFDHWELDGANVSSNDTYSLIMDYNHTLTAVYFKQFALDVEVKDELNESAECRVILAPFGSLYSDGDSEIYDRGTRVLATALNCPGYRFDHWELDGANVSRNDTYSLTMDRNHTLTAVYFKQFVLDVNVRDDFNNPVGCRVILAPSNSSLYGDGDSEIYDRGTQVLATALNCPGYRFDHWEFDGTRVGSSTNYTVLMDYNHTLRAVYQKKSFEGGGNQTTENPLYSFKYVAESTDARFDYDLLSLLSGAAELDHGGPLVILGGPEVVPYDWESVGVTFVKRGGYYVALEAMGIEFAADYGVRDYCVITLTDDQVIRVAGVTRYGTRAGLLYLLNNPNIFDLSGDRVLLLGWVDTNGNGLVELEEVFVLMSWS